MANTYIPYQWDHDAPVSDPRLPPGDPSPQPYHAEAAFRHHQPQDSYHPTAQLAPDPTAHLAFAQPLDSYSTPGHGEGAGLAPEAGDPSLGWQYADQGGVDASAYGGHSVQNYPPPESFDSYSYPPSSSNSGGQYQAPYPDPAPSSSYIPSTPSFSSPTAYTSPTISEHPSAPYSAFSAGVAPGFASSKGAHETLYSGQEVQSHPGPDMAYSFGMGGGGAGELVMSEAGTGEAQSPVYSDVEGLPASYDAHPSGIPIGGTYPQIYHHQDTSSTAPAGGLLPPFSPAYAQPPTFTSNSPPAHGSPRLRATPSQAPAPLPEEVVKSNLRRHGLGFVGMPSGHCVNRRGSSESLYSVDSVAASGAQTPLLPQDWGHADEVRRLGNGVGMLGIDEGAMEEIDRRLLDQIELDHHTTMVPVDSKEALRETTVKYLDSQNRLMDGERTVIVLNPRLGQRSYGTEKRFLCPQPMALVLGASWWSNVDVQDDDDPTLTIRRNRPPQVFISMSTDPTPSSEPSQTEWMNLRGDHVELDELDAETPVISGRAVARTAHVSTNSDPNRKKVITAQVTIVAPGNLKSEDRLIGTFPGKPMQIISKPSKKRQDSSSYMALLHGSIVSLYNRAKAQSGNTRFLGVSGLSSSFPAMDWRAMAGAEARPYAPADSHSTTFVARTGSWDPFIIYAVDLSLPTLDPSVVPPPAPYPGFPRPPVNAIPFDPESACAIHYNMPIVLQCLSTAVVSPVMIIRKVDGKSTAVGGGSLDGFVPTGVSHLPVAPGEALGEAVAQFRPLCLELYNHPSTPGATQNTFLSCLGDEIGVNPSREERRPVTGFETSSSGSPVSPTSPPSDSGSGTFIANGLTRPEYENQGAFYVEDASSHGTKVKKGRRLSASQGGAATPYPAMPSAVTPRPPSSLAKHKRRGLSLSSLTSLSTDSYLGRSVNDPPPRWTIDCGESCVWTASVIDIARHTFYVPPTVFGGKALSSNPPPAFTSHLYKTPVPAYPIKVQIPVVTDYEAPLQNARGRDTSPEQATMITLYGENFTTAFQAWLGSTPCSSQVIKSPDMMFISPPPRISGRQAPLRISLVRTDGVVFPSNLFYRDN
ncbi:hypothetical protein MNV49_004842 [Pseudohyphozyma bogoriensis]|nr:hypothetical protein MNV49_004842 [Pseudohyphozyma bogoriensis]